MPNNERLDKYCQTPEDHATWAALVETGGDYGLMAVNLGIEQSLVRGRLHRLRKRAARGGWSPDHDVTHETPEGYHLKGTSTLYKADGSISVQWVKTDQDREDRIEAMRIACAEMIEPIRGKRPPVKRMVARSKLDADLMATYLIGDHHIGMYSWAAETGHDYDVDIAEQILYDAFDALWRASPLAHKALIVVIGDFFHADNDKGVTPNSGYSLDTDGRHSRVIQSGIRMMTRTVEVALTRHEEVEVKIVAGNHDPVASLWLAHALAAVFDKNPRVLVSVSPRQYQFVTWGTSLIGTTHGDRCKPAALGEIMAVDAREAWGAAEHCHFYTGHVHHKAVQELRGVTVESLSVLCPGDAWHVASGYRSKRGMQLDVWHKRRGRVLTVHGTVEMINDA